MREMKAESAIAKAYNLPISLKSAVAICNVIRGKNPIEAMMLMEDVIKKKKAIPMIGEIGHRKKGHRLTKIASGRYPEKAAKCFIKLLRQAIANARQLGIDEEKSYINLVKANKGNTRYHTGRFYGRRFKSTHVFMQIRQR